MLGAERGLRAVERGLIWRRNDNRRLRQRAQETRQYREKPARVRSLSIEVSVVIFSKVMRTALKQSNDALCWMRVDTGLPRDLPALGRRFSRSLQRLLALDHGQLHSLFIFETDFFERLENSVLIHSVKGSCHE